MLFNSLHFLFFFPIVTALYFLFPHRYRWMLLLVASIYFYASFIPWYTLILFAMIFIDYAAGIMIERTSGNTKKLFLFFSIIANLGVLFFFKYFNFFNESAAALSHAFSIPYAIPGFSLLLPLGLSFHTFQSLSYTIEVYRGMQRAERHLGILALYVMFYPQLVAGPIERPQHMLHQFYEEHRFDFSRVLHGLSLMLWGFFKKIVIADRLALIVNQVYGNIPAYPGASLALATIFFAIQIYCDFSGYSDIAIGAARVMGFQLTENFRTPYFAVSVTDFWRKWHISLSSWFRDYLYIPLGGNRSGAFRSSLNLLVAFLVSGLWHGANWTFVFWGFFHGCIVLIERMFVYFRIPRLPRILSVCRTFLLVSFAWIFFRAPSFTDALTIIRQLFEGWQTFSFEALLFGESRLQLFISLISIIFLLSVEYAQQYRDLYIWFTARSLVFKSAIYTLSILIILVFGHFEGQEFIYFQF